MASTPVPSQHSSEHRSSTDSSSSSSSSLSELETAPTIALDDAPKEDSDHFKFYISRSGTTKLFTPEDSHCSTWKDAPNPVPFTSFGDDGVTATVNAYGHLLQFTRYLGAGSSGVFTADQAHVKEPYYLVWRAELLQDRYTTRDVKNLDYGLRLREAEFDCNPSLHYVHGRWPRYEYENDLLRITIQWIVHDGMVLQQLLVTNISQDSSTTLHFSFKNKMRIRDMDFLDHSEYHPAMRWHQHDSVPGPHGYGCTHMLRVERVADKAIAKESREGGEEAAAAPAGTEMPSTKMEPGTTDTSANHVSSVATVVSILIDGIAQRGVGEKKGEWSHNLGPLKSVEVTAAYKMLLLPQLQPSWKDLVIPADSTNVNTVLREATFSVHSLSILDLDVDPDSKDKVRGEDATTAHASLRPVTVAESQIPAILVSDFDKNVGTLIQKAGGKQTESPASPVSPVSSDSREVSEFPSRQIEFVVSRHLEHILSVCAIPVQPLQDENLRDTTEASAPSAKEKEKSPPKYAPVALTCGDISGHRMSTSASFFAFWFLITIAKRLIPMEDKPGIKWLRRRIYDVCRGHMEWLWMAWKQTQKRIAEEEVDPPSEGQPVPRGFAANYWVTGSVMPFSNKTWTPPNSATDTAFQLIKVYEFAKLYQTKEDQELANKLMLEVGAQWATALDYQDKRKASAWSHGLNEYVSVFRLDDHVWIWKGLKSMQDMNTVPWEIALRHPEVETSIIHRLVKKRNFQVTIQEAILRNFTTVNDFSGKRMLAVTRSARDTRFFLHARDTALFYGLDWGLALEQRPYKDVWENTIEAQTHHDESHETNWDNAIRFGLATVLGCRGKTINERSPFELVKSALEALLQTTSANAFFPGQLDMNTKRPLLFGDEEFRDFYFHASFEIPFILLSYSGQIKELYDQKVQPKVETESKETSSTPSKHNHGQEVEEMITSQPKWQQQLGPDGKRGGPRNLNAAVMMRKKIPFYSMVDSSNIVELDEEWLYNCPGFLLRERRMGEREVRDQIKSIARESTSGSNGNSNGVVARGAQDCLGYQGEAEKAERESQVLFSEKEGISTWMVDAPKRKKKRGKRDSGDGDLEDPQSYNSNALLWGKLNEPREAERAKKRFLWLYGVNHETALACHLASTDVENSAMSEFFDRHARHEKFFSDDTTRVLNTWDTEFHVSFYQLVDKSCPRNVAIATPTEREFPTNPLKKITQASMGFRFFGDFFDRYWTCYFIQHVPAWKLGFPKDNIRGSEPAWRCFPEVNPYLGYDRNSPHHRTWWQRKALELQLMERILAEVLRSTQEIFREIRKEVDVNNSNGLTSILRSEDYFASKTQLQNVEDMLQLIEDELSLLLEALSKWDTREKDRGHERPRWTRKDEVRYRGRIRKLEVNTSRQTRQLRTFRAHIVTLKHNLVASQDKVRDDLGLLGAENIRLFTYVTVVFLPLGFAASIFSMSEVPNGGLIGSMAVCAVVALALTVVALFNAKRMNAIFDLASQRLHEYSSEKMRETALARQYADKIEADMTNAELDDAVADASSPRTGAGDESPRTGKALPRRITANRFTPETVDHGRGALSSLDAFSSSWHIWFWIAYLFIELPPRRLLLAYCAMNKDGFSIKAIYFLVTSLPLLPLFVVSWIVQVVAYNVADGVRLLWECIIWLFSAPEPEDDPVFENRLRSLTHPSKPYRPLKQLTERLEKSAGARRTKTTSSSEKSRTGSEADTKGDVHVVEKKVSDEVQHVPSPV